MSEPRRSSAEPSPLDRPSAPAPSRAQKLILWGSVGVIAVLVIAIGAVGTKIFTTLADKHSAAGGSAQKIDAQPAAFTQDTPAPTAGAGPCTTVTVLASFENAEMVDNLAKAYDAQPRNINGTCVTVTMVKDKSGSAADNAASGFSATPDAQKPAVWIPDSHTWIGQAQTNGGSATVPGSGTSIGTTNVVLAMPEPLAKAISWTTKPPTWKQVFAVSGDPNVWKNLGHPEWGSFKLGKTSPLVASSGEAAMLASYGTAAGSLDKLTPAQVDQKKVVDQVKSNELATTHYMATPEHFLWHARQAEATGTAAEFLSAVIVDEKSVWDYDRGITSRDGITRTQGEPPKEQLVPVYPTDGVYVSDNPAVVLTGAWMDAAKTAAAKDFIRYAGTAQGQAVVRTSGYRDLHGALDQGVQSTAHLTTSPKTTIAFPGPKVVSEINKAFPNVRKRAQVLFLVDLSGSMNDTLPDGRNKLENAKDAIIAALDHFTAGDQVGLAGFEASGTGSINPGMVSPMADISTSRPALEAAVHGLSAQGDTPLYEAVDMFAKQQAQTWDPKKISAIVVLSDGQEHMVNPTIPTVSLDQTEADLTALHHQTPVLVFTLAYGADADVPTLQAISKASGAHFYDATDPTKVKSVLGDLVTSF
ncbi:vWA domain-containing protein [Microbacterium sp. ASV49]|uniref:Substrate-binding domain-containing protein n=1 Tax=Microbacterium candidum TaxID=3041922 RepID=A0ABT7MTI3_9MICO|nr:substrate-binding domain-containing protein [Microbacterium sp. ASV49]MDL9977760.1 substrate-binding domain-containing protein [Microbacterium sp. ASV49]